MSTRANITFVDQGNNIFTIPVSSDGYPSGIGPDLADMLKKTDCRSIRNNRVFLEFAKTFVIQEPDIDYKYEVDVSGEEFKIAVLDGTSKKQKFNGNLEEFVAWMDKH